MSLAPPDPFAVSARPEAAPAGYRPIMAQRVRNARDRLTSTSGTGPPSITSCCANTPKTACPAQSGPSCSPASWCHFDFPVEPDLVGSVGHHGAGNSAHQHDQNAARSLPSLKTVGCQMQSSSPRASCYPCVGRLSTPTKSPRRTMQITGIMRSSSRDGRADFVVMGSAGPDAPGAAGARPISGRSIFQVRCVPALRTCNKEIRFSTPANRKTGLIGGAL